MQSLEYDYDLAGNLDWIKDYKAGGTQTQTFHYDSLDRLIDATASGGTGGTYSQETYGYSSTTGNLTSKAGNSLGYSVSVTCPAGTRTIPHAASSFGSTITYSYDCNGNQVSKTTQGGGTQTRSFDAENRMVGVSGAATASFTYDGDGQRVKGTVGSTTTVYVGAVFEWSGSTSTMKRYYYSGSIHIALRIGNGSGTTGLSWLFGDHLGSTSLTVDMSAARTGELRFKPYGEYRFTFGTTPTTFDFTGQRVEVGIGLHYFQARWFDSALGRFISADTIIPRTGGVLAWDRYLYTLGNPLKYTDPSGHEICLDDGNCEKKLTAQTVLRRYGVVLSGEWSNRDQLSVLRAVTTVGLRFGNMIGVHPSTAFQNVFGSLTFTRSTETQDYWAEYGNSTITYYANAEQLTTLTTHELGHAIKERIANNGETTPYETLFDEGIWLDDGTQLAGYKRNYTVPGTGFTCNGQQCVNSEGNPIPANHYWRERDKGFGFKHSRDRTENEDFADMFGNWAMGSFRNDVYGRARMNFMTTNMSEWVHSAMGR